jgi:glycosyltransferase involved in cell wall biosynthesis
VNDGSEDSGALLVDKLFQELTPPAGGWNIITQKNSGVSTARNNGVKSAKYNYIAFLDADDWWEPDFLLEMTKLIEQYPEAGIYGCNYYFVKNNLLRIAPLGIEPQFNVGLINYLQVYAKTLCMPLTSISVVIPKSVYEAEHGFNMNLKLGEDFDLWVRIATKYPVAFTNKPLAYYNQDVVLSDRAVNKRLYEASEHMLFSDYGYLMQDEDFRYLYERLALYGLLPYYLAGKNRAEVDSIISSITWSQHETKYKFYYLYLPRWIVKCWFTVLKFGSEVKTCWKKVR